MNIKKAIEALGWLTAIMLFAYASHAALAQTSIDATAARRGEASARTTNESLTPEEEREAREFAGAFLNRLQEQGSLSMPFVRELFVGDFAGRLRHDQDNPPLALLAPAVRAQAGDDRLLDYYIAANNLTLATIMYCHHRQPVMKDGGSIGSAALEELFPPDVVDLLKTSPVLARSMLNDSDDAPSAAARIKSLEELRAATAFFEQAGRLLRARAPTLAELRDRERRGFQRATEPDETIWMPRASRVAALEARDTSWTRPVRIRMQPLMLLKIELRLVSDGGQLKVLSMDIEIDGD